MPVTRAISITLSTLILGLTAQAQTVVEVEPVPDQFEGIVRAQHIKPGDVSPEEYAKLIEEADKIRAFQQNQETTVYFPNSTQTQSQISRPTSPRIELFDAPVPKSATLTIPSAPATTNRSHTVVKGDTLYNISKRYGVTLSSLKDANSLDGNNIRLGQLLMIPGTTTSRVKESITHMTPTTLVRTVEPLPQANVYAVLPGDTLYSISKQACSTVSQIATLNNLSDISSLQPGQRLVMPGGHCLR